MASEYAYTLTADSHSALSTPPHPLPCCRAHPAPAARGRLMGATGTVGQRVTMPAVCRWAASRRPAALGARTCSRPRAGSMPAIAASLRCSPAHKAARAGWRAGVVWPCDRAWLREHPAEHWRPQAAAWHRRGAEFAPGPRPAASPSCAPRRAREPHVVLTGHGAEQRAMAAADAHGPDAARTGLPCCRGW